MSAGSRSAAPTSRVRTLAAAGSEAGRQKKTLQPTAAKEEAAVLVQVKGRRSVKVRAVPLATRAIQKDAAYTLISSDLIATFAPPTCSKMAMARCAEFAGYVRNMDKHARVPIKSYADMKSFCGLVEKKAGGGKALPNTGAFTAAHTEDKEDALPAIARLVLFSAAGRTVLEDKHISKNVLNPDTVAVIDCFSELYLWKGSQSTKAYRDAALEEFNSRSLSKKEAPYPRVVTAILSQNTEPCLFRAKFCDWLGPSISTAPPPPGPRACASNLDREVPASELAASLLTPITSTETRTLEFPTRVNAAAQGKWIATGANLQPQPMERLCHFSRASSYVLHHRYRQARARDDGTLTSAGSDVDIVFFWQGANSDVKEKGKSAVLTIELDQKELSGNATQVRVEHGKESADFLWALGGMIFIHMPGEEPTGPFLYEVFFLNGGVVVEEMPLNAHSFVPWKCLLCVHMPRPRRQAVLWIGYSFDGAEDIATQKILSKFQQELHLECIDVCADIGNYQQDFISAARAASPSRGDHSPRSSHAPPGVASGDGPVTDLAGSGAEGHTEGCAEERPDQTEDGCVEGGGPEVVIRGAGTCGDDVQVSEGSGGSGGIGSASGEMCGAQPAHPAALGKGAEPAAANEHSAGGDDDTQGGEQASRGPQAADREADEIDAQDGGGQTGSGDGCASDGGEGKIGEGRVQGELAEPTTVFLSAYFNHWAQSEDACTLATPPLQDQAPPFRLYRCSMGSGAFSVVELAPFSPHDLNPHSTEVYLLASSAYVFVWESKHAGMHLRRKACGLATAMMGLQRQADTGVSSRVLFTYSGREPAEFFLAFHAWVNKEAPKVQELDRVSIFLEAQARYYTLPELLQARTLLDMSRLETYLHPQEFERLFGMDRQEFDALPQWKQHERKRALGLY